ncbi:MAG: CDGSH iron-sulfur domain-containing protein [Rhodothermales bacterium]|nr:CDGSH iron-sulfur domain-containing protein [Rhodothermales bacterium]
MIEKKYTYAGAQATVTYDLARCIHAAACVRGLPAVFEAGRSPWITPDAAPAEAVAEAVLHCPTGALRVLGVHETGADEAVVTVVADGPLYVRGRLHVLLASGEIILEDTRMALCRCGASKNKPLCDNSHRDAGFSDPGVLGDPKLKEADASTTLRIKLADNGPLLLEGNVRIVGADGGAAAGVKCALCRCGQSKNKPYCDGTHKLIGFVA